MDSADGQGICGGDGAGDTGFRSGSGLRKRHAVALQRREHGGQRASGAVRARRSMARAGQPFQAVGFGQKIGAGLARHMVALQQHIRRPQGQKRAGLILQSGLGQVRRDDTCLRQCVSTGRHGIGP